MSDTTKPLSDYDQSQIIQKVYNPSNGTLGVDGFLVGKLGRKITRVDISPTVEDYSFFDGTTLLYTLRITYDNATHDNLVQAERTA